MTDDNTDWTDGMFTDDTDERFSTAALKAVDAYAEEHGWRLATASYFGTDTEEFYIGFSDGWDHFHTADNYQELLDMVTRHDARDCFHFEVSSV